MRKLASIQRIRSLEAIPGADAIQKATVLGWQLVVKKDEFRAGDLCVYMEIDSLLPERPVFEFLRSRNFRIRTMKLRGQVSQGICFPLHILPMGIIPEEGMDLTEALGVVKYEAPVPVSLSGIMKGDFPSFIPKTDETRVQVLEELLLEHAGSACYITEKLDGTSATYFMRDGVFGVCSRNMELREDERNTYWKVARALNLEEKLRQLNRNIAIQAELVGEQIQGNKLKLTGQQLFVFSVFLIDSYTYASFSELTRITDMLQLQRVPLINDHYLLEPDVEALLAMATRQSVICPEAKAEGIVIRVKDTADHVSFKAINNEFLLKYGE